MLKGGKVGESGRAADETTRLEPPRELEPEPSNDMAFTEIEELGSTINKRSLLCLGYLGLDMASQELWLESQRQLREEVCEENPQQDRKSIIIGGRRNFLKCCSTTSPLILFCGLV